MKVYRQKIFAGDHWFLWIGVLLVVVTVVIAVIDGIDVVDISLVGLYLIIFIASALWSATYPDIRLSDNEFGFRIWFWFEGVSWDAVKEIHPYPEEAPNGMMVILQKGKQRKIIIRKNSIESFDEIFARMEDKVPDERWIGWEYEDDF